MIIVATRNKKLSVEVSWFIVESFKLVLNWVTKFSSTHICFPRQEMVYVLPRSIERDLLPLNFTTSWEPKK